MAVTFAPAPAVAIVAGRLIADHHSHLDGQRIEYVYRSEPAKEGGKDLWGRARKVTGLSAYLARGEADELDVEDFFVVEIAEPIWNVLDDDQRVALVDHELTHCGLTDEQKLTIRPHDVEEFRSIIERHGLWRPDIEEFVKTGAVQMRLDETP